MDWHEISFSGNVGNILRDFNHSQLNINLYRDKRSNYRVLPFQILLDRVILVNNGGIKSSQNRSCMSDRQNL